MSENTPFRLGLVGAGAIAQAYGQACTKSEIVKLTAVVDSRVDAAEAMAEAHECLAFHSVEAMTDQMELDAVVVCTPPITHQDICQKLLARKIPLLCEKPLSTTVESAREMLDLAVEENVAFTMASKFRYVADVAKAKSIIASGIIGEVVMFENVFTGHVDMKSRWNSNPEISGGGVLIDNGTHSVDITRYFLGELAEVQVMEGNRIQDLPVEDTVKMFVRSRNGVLASIDLSWSVSKEQPYFISVYGSAGTLLVGWRESKYRRSDDKEWTVFGNGYDKVDAFVRQLENLAAAIRGHEPLLVSPADALASVEVIEAAYKAMDNKDWITIASEHSDRLLQLI